MEKLEASLLKIIMRRQIFNITNLSTVFILLFAIIFLYAFPKLSFCQDCAFGIPIYDDSNGDHTSIIVDELLAKREKISYELTGDVKTDREILKKYRNKVHQLIQSKDTTKIIRFKFNQNTCLQNFIDTFDTCLIEGSEYLYYENDLWTGYSQTKHPKNWKVLPPISNPTEK